MKTSSKLMMAPIRESEIVSAQRTGDIVAVQLKTYIGIISHDTFLHRLATAISVLIRGYHDIPDADVRLFLSQEAASELNDKLIEGIYYNDNGEYLGEQFNYRD